MNTIMKLPVILMVFLALISNASAAPQSLNLSNKLFYENSLENFQHFMEEGGANNPAVDEIRPQILNKIQDILSNPRGELENAMTNPLAEEIKDKTMSNIAKLIESMGGSDKLTELQEEYLNNQYLLAVLEEAGVDSEALDTLVSAPITSIDRIRIAEDLRQTNVNRIMNILKNYMSDNDV